VLLLEWIGTIDLVIPSTPEIKGSRPFEVYTNNITRLVQMSTVSRSSLERQLEELRTSIATATDAMKSVSKASKDVNSKLANIAEAVQSTVPVIDQMTTAITSRNFVYSWMTVMLVTFAEAYLEDVLRLLISQALSSSTLHDSVKSEITKKWVKEALRGRPQDWIKQLDKFGIGGDASNQADKLAVVWQRRHTLVHTAEPEIPNTAARQFLDAVILVSSFIESVDAIADSSS
jgi:hypothetical protein